MIKEYRTIAEIAGPLMVVRQVERATFDELVEIELSDGSVRRGKVLEVNGDSAVVQLFEANAGINLAMPRFVSWGIPSSWRCPGICWGACSMGWGSLSTGDRKFWRRNIGTSTVWR